MSELSDFSLFPSVFHAYFVNVRRVGFFHKRAPVFCTINMHITYIKTHAHANRRHAFYLCFVIQFLIRHSIPRCNTIADLAVWEVSWIPIVNHIHIIHMRLFIIHPAVTECHDTSFAINLEPCHQLLTIKVQIQLSHTGLAWEWL